jgi:hypothetical protein
VWLTYGTYCLEEAKGLEMLILSMHEVFSNSMDLRNGGSILSLKFIFHRDSCLMKMDIIIVVLQYLFQKVCKWWTDPFAQKIKVLFFLVANYGSKSYFSPGIILVSTL